MHFADALTEEQTTQTYSTSLLLRRVGTHPLPNTHRLTSFSPQGFLSQAINLQPDQMIALSTS
jgi:hypothetical protein